jgi:nitroreductase
LNPARPQNIMNTTISPEQLVSQMNWRYAVKQFDPSRKIGRREWAALEESMRLAPSSCGLQPWTFILVKDAALRAKLLPASRGQSQIVDASHLVVFAAKRNMSESDLDAHLQRCAEVRGVAVDSLRGFRGMMAGFLLAGMDEAGRAAWAKNQVFIALGALLAGAAFLGIDACPMEGFDHLQYDEILGLREKGLTAAVVATLGYRAAGDKYATAPKVRFLREQVFIEV